MATQAHGAISLAAREYGAAGPWVVLVHGGPGAGGYLRPLGEALADSFRVLEPLQRGSGARPLGVATHVSDLQQLVRARCEGAAIVVGHSWGAMLALAHAAAHPASVPGLVLIGCGTFDPESRDVMRRTLDGRTSRKLDERIARLATEVPDPDQRLRRYGALVLPLQSCDLVVSNLEMETCDARAHSESWHDMLRLQRDGVYPKAFQAIKAPVLMLHGAEDPHPGRLVAASLRPHLPQLEYREIERCGHYPWLERAARAEFVASLRAWLLGLDGDSAAGRVGPNGTG